MVGLEEIEEWTNEDKANGIYRALNLLYDGWEDDPCAVIDLLADAMHHFCKRENIDFEESLRIARTHYDSEMED